MPEIIVALDGLKQTEAVKLAETLKGHVWGFKFNDMLTWLGTSVIRKFKKYGNIFADAKLHDTPETVANCVHRLSRAGADIITVHSSGGVTMMQEAVSACGEAKIAAVTVLTSMSEGEVKDIYNNVNIYFRFACLAQQANVHGFVCPGTVSLELRKFFKNRFLIVPGVRPWGVQGKDYQTSISQTTVEADYLVVGRPITQSKDPVKAAQTIAEIFS